MKHDLVKIFGEQRAKSIARYKIRQKEQTILNSTIFTEFNDDPIYVIHDSLPELITNYNADREVCFTEEKIEQPEIHYLERFYAAWNPIDYINLVFTNLQPTKVLGDITMFTPSGVFKLTNASIDDSEKRMFYDDAILIV